ncbi:MAG: hypothetical protein WCK98_07585 [bacterium]
MKKHPKYWYRVTKYDPKKRREDGAYLDQTEWTEFNELKNPNYNFKDYLLTENAYIYAIYYFIELNKETDFQLFTKIVKNKLTKNSKIFTDKISLEYYIKKIFRENFGAKIRCNNMCVHFGWDYYMYIGSNNKCDISELDFGGVKIYIEKIKTSPYTKLNELL